MLYVACTVRAPVPYVTRSLRALTPYVLRALYTLVPHVLCVSPRAICGLISRVLWTLFSLRTELSRNLRTLCPNTTYLRSYFSV